MTDDITPPQESTDVISLKKKIIRQVEYYFGDYNLMKDKFMLQRMKEDDGWFSMDLMLKFKRLASLCSEPKTILEALSDADTTLLEIDNENQRIRRKTNRAIPEDNEEFRKALNARTVHVKGFQSEQSIDDIHEFLSEFGKVDGIHLQRSVGKKFKGSLFVTFAQLEDAQKFVDAPMVYYKVMELSKMSRNDYYEQLNNTKKQKNSEKQRNADDNSLMVLKVSGLTDDTIMHRDVKGVFESKGINSIVFFDRFEKMGHEGYLIFRFADKPEILLKECDFVDGEKVNVKAATVEFSIPEDEEKEKILNLYFKTKQMFGNRFSNHKKQGHQRYQKSQKRKGGTKTHFDSDGEGEEPPSEPDEKAAKLN